MRGEACTDDAIKQRFRVKVFALQDGAGRIAAVVTKEVMFEAIDETVCQLGALSAQPP